VTICIIASTSQRRKAAPHTLCICCSLMSAISYEVFLDEAFSPDEWVQV
jgi:hypothetical protein